MSRRNAALVSRTFIWVAAILVFPAALHLTPLDDWCCGFFTGLANAYASAWCFCRRLPPSEA